MNPNLTFPQGPITDEKGVLSLEWFMWLQNMAKQMQLLSDLLSQSSIAQFIPPQAGEDGDEGPPGPPGNAGVDGNPGLNGVPIPGQDGEDALVGFTGFPTKVLDSSLSGVLPVGNGGTGLSTVTANRVLYASATNTFGTSANFVFDGSTVTASAVVSSGTLTGQALVDISGASAGQVKFPATENSSSDVNTLDDYEEGTWTPVITFATPGDLAVTYTTQVGSYTKIGNSVRASFNIVTSGFTFTTSSGNAQITGIPFNIANVTSNNHRGALTFGGITKAGGFTQFQINGGANAAFFAIGAAGSGVATATVTATDMPSGGSVVLVGTITYQAAT